MDSKNKVEVKIHGKEYTVVGTEPHEYIQKVAMYIDKKMYEITNMNDRLSTAMVAVLSAINVADDYFKVSMDAEQLRAQAQQYADELEKCTARLKEAEKENVRLKENINILQIDLAKKETELKDFINNFDYSHKDNTVRIDNARIAKAK